MKYIKLLLFTFFPAILFSQTASENIAKKEITTMMNEQLGGWNRGSVEDFMAGYWKNDSLKFVSSRGVTKGWQNVFDKYKKSYPTKDSMGFLTFDILNIEMINNENAWVIGKWQVKTNEKIKEGFFTLLIRKISQKWFIILDHTS